MAPHITLHHTVKYDHLDRTSDHPTPCSGRKRAFAVSRRRLFFLLHGVTGAFATYELVRGYLGLLDQRRLGRHFLSALAAIYVTRGCPPLAPLLDAPDAVGQLNVARGAALALHHAAGRAHTQGGRDRGGGRAVRRRHQAGLPRVWLSVSLAETTEAGVRINVLPPRKWAQSRKPVMLTRVQCTHVSTRYLRPTAIQKQRR